MLGAGHERRQSMNKAAIITGAISLVLLLISLLAVFQPLYQVAGATFIIGIILALIALFLSMYTKKVK